MTDDLVAQLREYGSCGMVFEAADRIEKLERDILNYSSAVADAQMRNEELDRALNRIIDRWEAQKARIEKLEAALKHCINALKQYEMGDDRPRGPAGPVRPWLLGAMDNAIKVLEGKDD